MVVTDEKRAGKHKPLDGDDAAAAAKIRQLSANQPWEGAAEPQDCTLWGPLFREADTDNPHSLTTAI